MSDFNYFVYLKKDSRFHNCIITPLSQIGAVNSCPSAVPRVNWVNFRVKEQSRQCLKMSVFCFDYLFIFSQVTLIPEEAEDMWHTYNLLQVGDSLRASTIRSVAFLCVLFFPQYWPYWSLSSFGLSSLLSDIFLLNEKQSDVTNRKVQTESSTGSVGSSRVRTTLTLCVETIDFDSQACQLRVKGTNLQENQYVKVRMPLKNCLLSGIFNFSFFFFHISKVCCSSHLWRRYDINSVKISDNSSWNIPYVNLA